MKKYLTLTQWANHVYYALCLIAALWAALPPSAMDLLPPNWKPYVAAAAGAAVWIKGHWNLFINPNGTPASEAWSPVNDKAKAATQDR